MASAHSWRDLPPDLGLAHDSTDDRSRLKAHATRLGLDLGRFDGQGAEAPARLEFKPDMNYSEYIERSATFVMKCFTSAGPVA